MFLEYIFVKNFNSHAHVERDFNKMQKPSLRIISTHTLTWSVTRIVGKNKSRKRNFNSHAHVERDNDLKFVDTKIRISTHTLTWSVTHDITSRS